MCARFSTDNEKNHLHARARNRVCPAKHQNDEHVSIGFSRSVACAPFRRTCFGRLKFAKKRQNRPPNAVVLLAYVFRACCFMEQTYRSTLDVHREVPLPTHAWCVCSALIYAGAPGVPPSPVGLSAERMKTKAEHLWIDDSDGATTTPHFSTVVPNRGRALHIRVERPKNNNGFRITDTDPRGSSGVTARVVGVKKQNIIILRDYFHRPSYNVGGRHRFYYSINVNGHRQCPLAVENLFRYRGRTHVHRVRCAGTGTRRKRAFHTYIGGFCRFEPESPNILN